MAAPATQITGRTRSNDAYVFNGTVNVSRRYTVNGLNQYQAAVSGTQSTGFLYDDNGNLISDGTMCLFYDAENRLVFKRDWTADCANTSTTNQVALRYDPLGRLFEVGGPSGTTRFLYDGDELVMEFSVDALGTATLAKRYVHGPAADDPLVWYEGAGYGDPRFLHTDHQGSVVSIASGTSAAPLVINSYDEWGIPSASNAGRFQYTGQAWLPELGMYHYKARIYSPTLGRFLQTDPIGYDDQINLYAYVGNDPVNKTDPSGMYICKGDGAQCKALSNALDLVKKASTSSNLMRSEQKELKAILAKYGDAGKDNGITVRFDLSSGSEAESFANPISGGGEILLKPGFAKQYDNAAKVLGGGARDFSRFKPAAERAAVVAHEMKHILNARFMVQEDPRNQKSAYEVGGLVTKGNDSDALIDIMNGNK